MIGRGELQEPIQIHVRAMNWKSWPSNSTVCTHSWRSPSPALSTQVEEKTQEVQYLQKSTDQVLDAVPTPIIMIDQQGLIQYMNRASRETLQTEDWIARPLFDLLPIDRRTSPRRSAETRGWSKQGRLWRRPTGSSPSPKGHATR